MFSLRLFVALGVVVTLTSAFPQGYADILFESGSPDSDTALLQQAQAYADLQQQMQQQSFADNNFDGSLVRNRRLTCDVFSFQSQWVTPNHAACAIKCAAQFWKYKGGRCENGNCHCTPRG